MEQDVDWSKVEPAVTDFVFYQAEKYLDAQFQSGMAADSRAITATSIFVGLCAAATAGTGSLMLACQPAAWATGILAVSFGVASYLCFRACEPVDFYPSGNQPKQWSSVLGESLALTKGGEIENYQEMISDNERALDLSARRLRMGVLAALAGPVVAVLALLGLTSFS